MEMNDEYRVTWFDKDSEKDCEIITFNNFKEASNYANERLLEGNREIKIWKLYAILDR